MARSRPQQKDPLFHRTVTVEGVEWIHKWQEQQLALADMVIDYKGRGLEWGKIQARKMMILEGLI